MGTSRQITEARLKDAKHELGLRVAKLEQEGVARNQFKRDPKWRELDARARQIAAQLKKIGQVEALNEEVAARKAAKLAGVTESDESSDS